MKSVCTKSVIRVGYLGLIKLKGKKIALELVSLAVSDIMQLAPSSSVLMIQSSSAGT